jgi:hypothetical protein
VESAAQTRPDHRDVMMPRPRVALATTPRDCLRMEVAIAVTLMMLIAVGAGSASAEEGGVRIVQAQFSVLPNILIDKPGR